MIFSRYQPGPAAASHPEVKGSAGNIPLLKIKLVLCQEKVFGSSEQRGVLLVLQPAVQPMSGIEWLNLMRFGVEDVSYG